MKLKKMIPAVAVALTVGSLNIFASAHTPIPLPVLICEGVVGKILAFFGLA